MTMNNSLVFAALATALLAAGPALAQTSDTKPADTTKSMDCSDASMKAMHDSMMKMTDANKKAAAHMLDGAKDAAKGVKAFVSENGESLAGIGGIYGEIARRAFSPNVSGGEHSVSNAPPLLTPSRASGTTAPFRFRLGNPRASGQLMLALLARYRVSCLGNNSSVAAGLEHQLVRRQVPPHPFRCVFRSDALREVPAFRLTGPLIPPGAFVVPSEDYSHGPPIGAGCKR